MSGPASGLFTLLRSEDPTKKHMLMVRCDLCRTIVAFDERLPTSKPEPEKKVQQIMRTHVCIDLREPEKKPKAKPPRKYQRLGEVEAGTLRERLSRIGWEDE